MKQVLTNNKFIELSSSVLAGRGPNEASSISPFGQLTKTWPVEQNDLVATSISRSGPTYLLARPKPRGENVSQHVSVGIRACANPVTLVASEQDELTVLAPGIESDVRGVFIVRIVSLQDYDTSVRGLLEALGCVVVVHEGDRRRTIGSFDTRLDQAPVNEC